MKNTIKLLKAGFESSGGKTPEFKAFTKVFKKEFGIELKSIGATDIVFSVGHFSISGFITVNNQTYYFSLSDVRVLSYSNEFDMLYRTVTSYKDYTGGMNRYIRIENNMSSNMI